MSLIRSTIERVRALAVTDPKPTEGIKKSVTNVMKL